MATQWKYKHEDEELGPFTSGQLKQLAAEGKLNPHDLVWKDGLTDWVPAQRVKGLFESDTKNAAAALSGLNLGSQIESPNPSVPAKNSTPDAEELPHDQPSQAPIGKAKPGNTESSQSSRKLPKAQPLDPTRLRPSESAPPPSRRQAGSTPDTSSPESQVRALRRKFATILVVSVVAGTLLVAAAVLLGPKLFHSEPPLVEHEWLEADFVLTGNDGFTVGVDYDADKNEFYLRAKAEGEQVAQSISLASKTATSVIKPNNGKLAGYVHRRHEVGDKISSSLAEQIALYWPIDRRPWLRATFLITNGDQFALAVEARNIGELVLLAKADGATADNVVQYARDAGARIVQPEDDERLVAEIYRSVEPARSIGRAFTERISKYWPFDRRQWLAADFILSGSAGHAIAIDFRTPDEFYVLASTSGEESKMVDDLAQAHRIPTIHSDDDQLAANIFRKHQPAEAIESQLSQRLLDYWPIKKSLWRGADFIMVNPTEIAAAVKYQEADNYELLAIADSPNSQRAVQVAWESRIPIIARDPQLTRKLHDETTVGANFNPEISRRISEHWRSYSFLPASENFVSFHDVQLKQWRVGFLLEEADEHLRIQPLGFDAPVEVALARVAPGSLVKAQGMSGLRELRNIEFLDYCATQIGRALETPQGQRSHVYAVVNPVKVDINEEELALSKTLDTSRQDNFFAFQARALGSTYRHDPRKEPARILRQFAQSLQSELQTRLSRLHVPLLEREELDALLAERGRAGIGFEMSDVSDQPLLGPTHIVFSEIRHSFRGGDLGAETHKAARQGEFELAVRLVDVRTGEILWTDQMWPPRGEAAPSRIPNYLLDSGELAVLELSGSGHEEKTTRGESWPLGLPPLKSPTDKGKINPLSPRLGYLEQDGNPLQFRDLFSRKTVAISADAVAVRRISNSAGVPKQHRMRYLVWQIAREVLPSAARVTDVQGAAAKIGLGDAHGLQNGSELRAIRIDSTQDEATLKAQRTLQVQLKVTQAQQRSSRVFVTSAGSDQLQPGDIVFVQQIEDAVVAIVPPRAGLFDAALRQQFSRWNEAQMTVMLDKAENRADELAGRLSIALNQLRIDVKALSVVKSTLAKFSQLPDGGLTKEQAAALADELGVTHLVYGEIMPTYHVNAVRASDRLTVNLKVFATATSQVITLPRFDLTARQFEDWQP